MGTKLGSMVTKGSGKARACVAAKLALLLLAVCGPMQRVALGAAPDATPLISICQPMVPPAWAIKQRELLKLNSQAAHLFGQAYVLPNGEINVAYEHGGGVEAPDDLLEYVHKLPLLYALGADQVTWCVWWKVWQGSIRQCTRQRLFHNEMPKYLDWHHNGEHYQGFWLAALCAPDDPEYRRQALKFASFFDGSNPSVPNYDPQSHVMRSMLTGGAGPVLEPTEEHWGGGEVWRPWLDCVHDGPINLVTTCFGTNAFMLTGDEHYRRATLSYIDAWRRRARANGGVVPSIVLPDGTVPREWWRGVMGWDFTAFAFGGVFQVSSGPRAAWGNALLLTGDASYFDCMRALCDEIWRHRFRDAQGQLDLPSERGKDGWYGSQRRHRGGQRIGVYASMLANVYLASMWEEDLARVCERREAQGYLGHQHPFYEGGNELDWIDYLGGGNPGWPEKALDEAIAEVQKQIARLSPEAQRGPRSNRSVAAASHWHAGQCGPLVNLMAGGVMPLWHGQLHHACFRYFDPERRRPGIPPECAALVRAMTEDSAALVLVNTSKTKCRTVLVQTGVYAEHQCVEVRCEGDKQTTIDGPRFAVRLAPGTGARLGVRMRRYVNTPSLRLPWQAHEPTAPR
jgi:hypothetical protein